MSTPEHLSGEVIGFRQWKVGPNLELQSGNAAYNWAPGINTAKCSAGLCTHAPGKDCHCGLYALHSPDDFWYGEAKAKNAWLMSGIADGLYVAGLISAWGRIEVHHDGFRAEHAQVVAIAMPDAKRGAALARGVAYEYKVPRVPESELARMASEYGTLIPEDLRPEKPAGTVRDLNKLYAQILGQYQQYKAQPIKAPQSNHFYWSTTTATTWPQWSAEYFETSKPGDGSISDQIKKLKKPINDPRNYLPKRKGGNQ